MFSVSGAAGDVGPDLCRKLGGRNSGPDLPDGRAVDADAEMPAQDIPKRVRVGQLRFLARALAGLTSSVFGAPPGFRASQVGEEEGGGTKRSP